MDGSVEPGQSQNSLHRIVVKPDSSVDVYFGPTAPPGKENNWIQTDPGKCWSDILSLYAPLEPWFEKTLHLGEVELAK